MKIKITSGYCLRRGVDVFPGEVIEATRHEALRAFALGRAVPAAEDEQAVDATPADAQPAALAAQKPRTKWGRK